MFNYICKEHILKPNQEFIKVFHSFMIILKQSRKLQTEVVPKIDFIEVLHTKSLLSNILDSYKLEVAEALIGACWRDEYSLNKLNKLLSERDPSMEISQDKIRWVLNKIGSKGLEEYTTQRKEVRDQLAKQCPWLFSKSINEKLSEKFLENGVDEEEISHSHEGQDEEKSEDRVITLNEDEFSSLRDTS